MSLREKPLEDKAAELDRWVRRGLTSSIAAGLINVLGLALTLALLALGSPLAAGFVIGSLILVVGLSYLYGRIVRDKVGGLFDAVQDVREWRILSHSGEEATMTLKRHARVLQDGVFAIRDFAWGSKDSHKNPRCDRWPVVYQYPDHGRTVAIIALEEVKNRDDSLEYGISWDVEDVFVDLKNWVETEVLHDTVSLTLRIVFPGTRAPLKPFLTHSSSPDKREELSVKHHEDNQSFVVERALWYPKRHETYRITWQWAPDDIVAPMPAALTGQTVGGEG